MFYVVVALRCVLPFDGALDAIAHQKDRHVGSVTFGNIHGEPKRIIRSFVSIWTIVDDEQVIYRVVFGQEAVSFFIDCSRTSAAPLDLDP